MIVEEKGNETAFYNALSCTKAIRLSQGYWPLLYLVSNLNDYEISIKKVTNLFLKLANFLISFYPIRCQS